jgi:hypothetical protein
MFWRFKSVKDYDAALQKIVRNMRIANRGAYVTEAELIEKTLSTFSVDNFNLAEQYRGRNWTTYAQCFQHLLQVEGKLKTNHRKQ